MEYSVFCEQLRDRIFGMSADGQLRLALEICKRLYPDYASFHYKHKWGSPEILLDSIRAFENALEGRMDIPFVGELRSRIDAVIPDTDDFGDHDGSYALNASATVAYTLQFVLDKSPESVLHAATLYYETANIRVNEAGVSDEQEIERNPLIEEARRFLLGL